MSAICVACSQSSNEMPEYSADDPVESDGTYADGGFVCGSCYGYLIDLGLDVGTPQELQAHAIKHVRGLTI